MGGVPDVMCAPDGIPLALFLLSPKDIEDSEYDEFYKSFTKVCVCKPCPHQEINILHPLLPTPYPSFLLRIVKHR